MAGDIAGPPPMTAPTHLSEAAHGAARLQPRRPVVGTGTIGNCADDTSVNARARQ